ncbi:hypothetical protein APY04_1865 [Hyphomicrobium sulfonivorans]|uniref:Uncharacterized protein n=1 Tax=Hyphomicrobium sulfonivorans TaxID=121290 RepID=A0A109BEY1_HYPSL|nr:hypothetical protein [Hyphomicrobium sulfonivorans]KWT67506.1 hypothetical protein APY04_1865 [Hyphomicrobium sulfonivorans]
MDYQKLAGDILFGGDILDNAMRGIFIEAVVLDALRRTDDTHGTPTRWHHIGLGWGLWDLQRGTAAGGDRVRVQVKTSAAVQLWQAPSARKEARFTLGWTDKPPPPYFAQSMDVTHVGGCEPTGYRADILLLAWHETGRQSNPADFEFFLLPTRALQATATPPKRLLVRNIRENWQSHRFGNLPSALNAACDSFLASEAGAAVDADLSRYR